MTLQSLKKWHKLGYDFNLQLMNDEFNLFVEKNDVDLFCAAQCETESEAVKKTLEYLERVNPKK